jgi:hypothetical protein
VRMDVPRRRPPPLTVPMRIEMRPAGLILALALVAASCGDAGPAAEGDGAAPASVVPIESPTQPGSAGDVAIETDPPVTPTPPAESPAATPSDDPADGIAADDGNDADDGEWTVAGTVREREVEGAPIVTAFRIARNSGFDRMVVEMGEGGIPSYRIDYIDRPVRQCGSGNEVPLRGDGWLSIRLEPAMAHTDEGRPTLEERSGSPGLPIILDHSMTCDFEGQVEWVLGVRSPNAYRVLELTSPPRLVVDVRHQ